MSGLLGFFLVVIILGVARDVSIGCRVNKHLLMLEVGVAFVESIFVSKICNNNVNLEKI